MMFSYSMLFYSMQFCLKIPIEKPHTLEIVKQGNFPTFEQPSMRKKTKNQQLGKVRHQFIAGLAQAAVPDVTKDVA